jgi:hypothetical protein
VVRLGRWSLRSGNPPTPRLGTPTERENIDTFLRGKAPDCTPVDQPFALWSTLLARTETIRRVRQERKRIESGPLPPGHSYGGVVATRAKPSPWPKARKPRLSHVDLARLLGRALSDDGARESPAFHTMLVNAPCNTPCGVAGRMSARGMKSPLMSPHWAGRERRAAAVHIRLMAVT